MIESALGEVIRQNMSYDEATAMREAESDIIISREAWSTWFYCIELNPVRLEVRCHPQHYTVPLTEEDRQAHDWFAVLKFWAEGEKEWELA